MVLVSQLHRFYWPSEIKEQQEINLDADASRIVQSVLRLNMGDAVFLMDGKGLIAQAELTNVTKKAAICKVGVIKVYPSPLSKFYLLQALLKGEKSEWLVQKATELGAAGFYFFEGDHSVSKTNSNLVKKLEKTAVEAMRQSGNPFLPEIRSFTSLKAFLKDVDISHMSRIWMNETEETHHLKDYLLANQQSKIIAAVGPEGGWSPEEGQLLKDQDFCSIRLGSYILRSETAAVSIAANVTMMSGSHT